MGYALVLVIDTEIDVPWFAGTADALCLRAIPRSVIVEEQGTCFCREYLFAEVAGLEATCFCHRTAAPSISKSK